MAKANRKSAIPAKPPAAAPNKPTKEADHGLRLVHRVCLRWPRRLQG